MSLDELRPRTWALVEAALPDRRFAEHAGCFLYAIAAQAALQGTGARFTAGGAFLRSSQMTGWGVYLNPAIGGYLLGADREVDEEGGYCGHCWVETGSTVEPTVLDVMDGYVGPRLDPAMPVVYHPVGALARSIRRHYAEEIAAVQRAARRDPAYRALVAAIAG